MFNNIKKGFEFSFGKFLFKCGLFFIILTIVMIISSCHVHAESNESNFYFQINNTFNLGTRNYIWLSANENMRLSIKNNNVYNYTGGTGVFPLAATSGYVGLCVSNDVFNIPYFENGSGLKNVQFIATDNSCTLFNHPNGLNSGKIVYFIFDIDLYDGAAWSFGTQTYNWVNNNNVSITWTNYYGTDIGLYSYGFSKDRFYPSADTSGTTKAVKNLSTKIDTTHGILRTISSAITSVINALSNIPSLVYNAFSSMLSNILNAFSTLWNNINAAFTNLFDWLSDIYDSIQDILSDDEPTSQYLEDFIDEFIGSNDNIILEFITLPIQFLTAVLNSNTCSSISLGTLFGTELILPCLGTKIASILGSSLYTFISVILTALIYWRLSYFLYDVIEKVLTLSLDVNEKFNIDL